MVTNTISSNLAAVKRHIDEVAIRSGRAPADIKLVAVSKTRSLAEVKQAIEAGQFWLDRGLDGFRVDAALATFPDRIKENWGLDVRQNLTGTGIAELRKTKPDCFFLFEGFEAVPDAVHVGAEADRVLGGPTGLLDLLLIHPHQRQLRRVEGGSILTVDRCCRALGNQRLVAS